MIIAAVFAVGFVVGLVARDIWDGMTDLLDIYREQ